MFYGEYDSSIRTLQYINAGHCRPILISATGEATLLPNGDLPIGLFPEMVLSGSQLYAWKKRLGEAEGMKFVEVEVVRGEGAARPGPMPGRAIEVRLNGGRSLVVEPGFDAQHLRALLAVLDTEA
jgi:Stage II sporulation protein E (SpoIIE)